MIMKPEYIYLITRAHGMSTHLFKEDDYKNLVRSPDLKSYVEAVTKGEYIKKITSVPKERVDARLLSSVFGEIYVDRLLYLIKVAGGRLKDFLDMFARRVEVENIKRVLRAKFSGGEISVQDLIPLPREFTYVNIVAMIDSPTYDDALYHLTPSPYKNAIEYSQFAKTINSPFPVELGIETEYYRRLTNIASRLAGGRDVSKVLGTEYGSKIIFYVMSLKMLESPLTYLEKYVSRISRIMGMEESLLRDFIRAKEDTALDIINRSPYKWIFKYIEEPVLKRDISGLYYSVLKAFKVFIDSYAARYPLSTVYILWYLYAIEYEYRNLSGIALAKELGLKPDEIMIY